MLSRDFVFWEVDVQADFMLPGGKLYVPGAEKLLPNIRRLTDAARRGEVVYPRSGEGPGVRRPRRAFNPRRRRRAAGKAHCRKAGAPLNATALVGGSGERPRTHHELSVRRNTATRSSTGACHLQSPFRSVDFSPSG